MIYKIRIIEELVYEANVEANTEEEAISKVEEKPYDYAPEWEYSVENYIKSIEAVDEF